MSTNYATDQVIGARMDDTNTVAQFAVGTRVAGRYNTEWLYVQASGAVTQYDTVAVDEDFTARAITGALAADAHNIGFAQVAFADNEYGWVALKGSTIRARVAASASADSTLYTTGTAGVLDAGSNTSGNVAINGVVTVTSNSSSGVSNHEIIATFPHTK